MSPMSWWDHLIVPPVVLPLITGALLIPVSQKHH